MSKRVFARHQSPRDQRDDKFLLPAKTSPRISRYWNDRWISADQKQTPHCVAFAFGHWLACSPLRKYVDPHGLYDGCKLIDGAPGDGTYVRAGAEILRKGGWITKYSWARSLKSLVYTVLEMGPVVVGTDWYEGMDAGGLMQLTGSNLGGHAYLIVGANQRKRLFKIKNSWGRRWGDHGYAWISFADMERLLKDGGEVCLATKSKPETKWLRARK